MHRLTIWVCCLILVGCYPTDANDVDVIEIRSQKLVAKVKLIKSNPPITLTMTVDEGDNTSYASKTEHDCKQQISTLRYLAMFDKDKKLVNVLDDIELELIVDPGSIGEAELLLACPKGMI